ncbi:MAG: acetylxylan esterase, partial [Bacteroidales bacterium]|nr:acetylxylan esterase [Bacteroidales bacterium]
TLAISNPNATAVTAEVKLCIATDKGLDITTVEQSMAVEGGQNAEMPVTVTQDLEPGFYKARFTMNGKTVKDFVFGVNPMQLVSAPDMQEDFDAYWADAKAQLEAIDMKAELTEIPGRSTAGCKVYLVEMQSVPDSPDGDPVIIRGYYLEPQDGQKHPVILHFYGYDTLKNPSALYCPSAVSNPTYAEFYLSTRGQIINNRTADKRAADGKGDFINTYGDWFAFQFGDRDGYYYRGAYMDCVQAARFMATRPTSDMNNLFAEGSSQGGAFTYAVTALSGYSFRAIAPCVAFLGDFPDYFQIAYWPANVAKKSQGEMSDEDMYAFLSYFDTKNLATRISCPVLACSGLQDSTCPPHTNVAPFNNLQSTEKQMHFYPNMQHEIPKDWNAKMEKFFQAHMQ